MALQNKLKDLFCYKKSKTLVYDEALRKSYLTGSVCGNCLEGKTAVVTGATGDIGTATCLRFLIEGMQVIGIGRDKDRLGNLKSLCEQWRPSGELFTLTFDFDHTDKMPKFVEEVRCILAGAPLDILNHSAGVFSDCDKKRRFRGITNDEFLKDWNLNYKSVLNLTNALIADGLISSNGVVQFISSICATQPSYQYTPYGLSKSALEDYADTLSKNKPGLVVQVFEPGSVVSRMSGLSMGSDISSPYLPLFRFLIPEEIAALAAHLASQNSYYVEGAVKISAQENLRG